jgi:DNA-binding response OmpR family regulator
MKTPKILVVEDYKEHVDLIISSLGEGYNITWVATMADTMRAVDDGNFDLFLLDIMLPDGDGYQICTHLKAQAKTKDTPIIFLSSKKEVTDKVIGFSLGAEDYIVKPCAPLELKARVDSKLRHAVRSDTLVLPGLQFNFLTQKVTLRDASGVHEIELTPREYKLLTFMAHNTDAVLSREQILKSVWGKSMHVSDRSIDTHVAALRKKLGSCSHYIKSVHGTGYRFVPDSVDGNTFQRPA